MTTAQGFALANRMGQGLGRGVALETRKGFVISHQFGVRWADVSRFECFLGELFRSRNQGLLAIYNQTPLFMVRH